MENQLSRTAKPYRYSIGAMVTKRRLFVFTGLAIVTLTIVAVIVLPRVNRWMVGQHQSNVIREFDLWSDEYSQITDHESAVRSAGMIDYIWTYYTPSDGYRADPETEQRLNNAQHRSIAKIADALSAYTGTVVANPLDWPAEICDNTRQIQDGE